MNEWESAYAEAVKRTEAAEAEVRRKQALLDAAPRMLEALLEVEAGRRGDYTNSDGDHILVCLGGKEINVSDLVRTARGET